MLNTVYKNDKYDINRWLLFAPVSVAGGVFLYFFIDFEPNFFKVLLYCLSSLGFLLFLYITVKNRLKKSLEISKKYTFGILGLFLIEQIIFINLGFLAGKIRTEIVSTKYLIHKIDGVKIKGTVSFVEDVPRGTAKNPRIIRRLILGNITGLPKNVDSSGLRLRLQCPKKSIKDVKISDCLTVVADIYPPQLQITKSGYDLRFDCFFKNISGLGKIKKITKIQKNISSENLSWFSNFPSKIKKIRESLKNEIDKKMNANAAPIASSLIVGDKSGLSINTRDDFSKAGISHILAISGLHMGLLAGFVFFSLIKLLVLIPRFATRFVVKKFAGLATIPIAFLYLLLSGVSFSALRAFIMITIAMIAIIINQNPISLRSTAFVASFILLIFPESLFSISFQLSFASVAGLCYFYEQNKNFYIKKRKIANDVGNLFLKKVFYKVNSLFVLFLNILLQSVTSTVIATIFTMPIIIYSFQKITLVGVFGNILAVPLLSFIVLPLGFICVLSLLFFNSDFFVVKFLFSYFEKGIDIICSIAKNVAELKGSEILIAKTSSISVVLVILSLLWLIIWTGRKKWFFLPLLISGVFIFFQEKPADIFVIDNIIGLRQKDKLMISSLRKGSFHGKVWSQECGVNLVEQMDYATIEDLRNKYSRYFIKAHEGDLTMIWLNDDVKESLVNKHETVCFHKKKRPWYDF